jgi:hypothetical protein
MVGLIISIAVAIIISILWVRGIDNMKQNPDYKGYDLFDEDILIETLNEAFAAAEEENKQGIANFIAERLDAHGKHGWMLRSILKRQRA